ncbi:MAG: hypothetical protein IJ679_11145 [Lachnospiraceae bacterium]|nr:hypothetical protein [Lachnospiraceae bacterium]
MTKKEKAKVTHEINAVWHSRYKGKKYCVIVTHPNSESPAYIYRFVNHGFDNYEFIGKFDTEGE